MNLSFGDRCNVAAKFFVNDVLWVLVGLGENGCHGLAMGSDRVTRLFQDYSKSLDEEEAETMPSIIDDSLIITQGASTLANGSLLKPMFQKMLQLDEVYQRGDESFLSDAVTIIKNSKFFSDQ